MFESSTSMSFRSCAHSMAPAAPMRSTCAMPASQIPTPALLAKVVDKLDKLDMGARDTKGDVYEYMLAKIATAGQNGQFRTPAPYHRDHGGADGADAGGRHVRSGLRHLRFPGRGRRISAQAPPGPVPGRQAAASISTRACSTASISTRRCCASAP